MAITLSFPSLGDRARWNQVAVLRELSAPAQDVRLLDGLIPDELHPAADAPRRSRPAALGLTGWQRALGVSASLVVVAFMIMAPQQVVVLLLWLSAGAALVMTGFAVTPVVLTRTGHRKDDR